MEQLLSLLITIPEYKTLLESVRQGQNAAVTGIGQINRSHLIAGLYSHTDRPVVVICQDDMTAKRMGQELAAGKGFPLGEGLMVLSPLHAHCFVKAADI